MTQGDICRLTLGEGLNPTVCLSSVSWNHRPYAQNVRTQKGRTLVTLRGDILPERTKDLVRLLSMNSLVLTLQQYEPHAHLHYFIHWTEVFHPMLQSANLWSVSQVDMWDVDGNLSTRCEFQLLLRFFPFLAAWVFLLWLSIHWRRLTILARMVSPP